MRTLERWVERLYAETDVGRSVATSVAGLVGLLVYLSTQDWVLGAFALIIAFPLARLVAGWIHAKMTRAAKRQLDREEAERVYDAISEEEKIVVRAFVQAGGTVLTWSHVNKLSLPGPAIESLMERGLLRSSVTADGMRETFVLAPEVFDVALEQE